MWFKNCSLFTLPRDFVLTRSAPHPHTFANKAEMLDALRLWRKELGPALGLVHKAIDAARGGE